MTIVNHDTGEITDAMTPDAARKMTTQAQQEFKSSADHFKNGWALIELAVLGGGHVSLGYRSPGDYLHAEFDGLLSNLDVAERRLAVKEMSALGLSSRAIAPVLGVSHKTVVKDNQVVPEVPPAESPQAEVSRPSVVRDATTEAAPGAISPRPAVTGLDGKVYKMPERPRLAAVPETPVLDGQAAEYANAEKASKSLSNAIAKLLEFQHPNMREAMRRYWSMASNEVPPTPRRDVTPEQMRAAAQGLLALADEWSSE